jgi:hypothetical protein
MTTRQLSTKKIVNLPSDPASGTAGELYYNTTANVLRYHNGSSWTNVDTSGESTNGVTLSDTPPLAPNAGQLWYETDTGVLYVYYDSYWIEAAGSTYDEGTVNGFPSTATVSTTSVDYTVLPNDQIIFASASVLGNITLTLPTAVGVTGKQYIIKKVDPSRNLVIVDGSGTETIDGSATQSLNVQYEALTIVSDGSNWMIV